MAHIATSPSIKTAVVFFAFDVLAVQPFPGDNTGSNTVGAASQAIAELQKLSGKLFDELARIVDGDRTSFYEHCSCQ